MMERKDGRRYLEKNIWKICKDGKKRGIFRKEYLKNLQRKKGRRYLKKNIWKICKNGKKRGSKIFRKEYLKNLQR